MSILNRENKVLETRLNNRKLTWEQVADESGYASAGAAFNAARRAMERRLLPNIEAYQMMQLTEIGVLKNAVWPIATANVVLALQYLDKEKRTPALCRDTPDEDDPTHVHSVEPGGYHVCYVVPAKEQMGGLDQVRKLMEREAKIIGIDHADGLAERVVKLNEDYQRVLAATLEAIINDPEVGISPEKRLEARKAAGRHLRAVSTEEVAEAS